MRRKCMNHLSERMVCFLGRRNWGIFWVSVLMLCLTGVTSCHHIPLFEPATGVYLVLDISYGSKTELSGKETFPDKDFWKSVVDGRTPQQYRLCLYEHDTGKLMFDDFFPAEGGFIEAPTGYYDLIVYSLGAEAVRVGGLDSRGYAMAYTSPTGSAVKLTKITKTDEDGDGVEDGEAGEPGDEEKNLNIQYPIHYMPDHVYVGRAENVYIPVRSNISKAVSVGVNMETMLDTYTFEAFNIEGAERISQMTCYITGQVTGKHLWDDRLAPDLCAIPVPVLVDNSGETSIRGVFNTLGKHPNAMSNVFLNIMIKNAQGEYYQWIFDVTDQFHNPDNVRHEIIIANRMVVPDVERGGFSPDVGDWEAEIIHVPL